MSKSSKANTQAQSQSNVKEEIMTTQTQEQAAALQALRQQKEIDEALAKTEQPTPVEVPDLEFASSAPFAEDEIEMSQFWADMKAKLPSGKRAITALLVSVAASTTAVYGVNVVCAYAVAGVLALSGSALLAMIISALGWIIAALAAFSVGRRVFAAIITGDYGVKIPQKFNPLNWFGKSEPTTVAS